MQTFENLFSINAHKILEILYPNCPWVCVINVCSSGSATCIIGVNISRYGLNNDSSIS